MCDQRYEHETKTLSPQQENQQLTILKTLLFELKFNTIYCIDLLLYIYDIQ
jgi:ribosomal protein L29